MATTAAPVQKGYSQAPLHQGGPLSMQYQQPHSAQERYEGSFERERERQLQQERERRMQEEEAYRRQIEEQRRLEEASRRRKTVQVKPAALASETVRKHQDRELEQAYAAAKANTGLPPQESGIPGTEQVRFGPATGSQGEQIGMPIGSGNKERTKTSVHFNDKDNDNHNLFTNLEPSDPLFSSSFDDPGNVQLAHKPSSPRSNPDTSSARLMASFNSRGGSSERSGNLPFTQTDTMSPPLLHTESRQDNAAMTAWTTQEQPLSSYNISHPAPQLQRSMSQRAPEMSQVPEGLEAPYDFLRRTMGTPPLDLRESPPQFSLDNHPVSWRKYSP
jgi:hypothetical protein